MVEMLQFTDGLPFATGASPYVYQPATETERTLRIILDVEVEGVKTTAVLDTGAPYFICSPDVVKRIGLSPEDALDEIGMRLRTDHVRGRLHRLDVTFPASDGEGVAIRTTAFVPDDNWSQDWSQHPSFIGLGGCLERMRFAVDPSTDYFYFGALD